MRAVGEDPDAAAGAGIGAARMKFAACGICGVLCGLAGAQLALALVTQWVQGMTAGRGFVALVAVMLARSHPVGVAGASVLFGFAYALAVRLQGVGIPPQFVSMLPYVLTIAVLVVMQRTGRLRLRRPAAPVTVPPAGP
jgi:simple sugar transport system permease protein